eukprot:4517612-Amphidinium_carterae.1
MPAVRSFVMDFSCRDLCTLAETFSRAQLADLDFLSDLVRLTYYEPSSHAYTDTPIASSKDAGAVVQMSPYMTSQLSCSVAFLNAEIRVWFDECVMAILFASEASSFQTKLADVKAHEVKIAHSTEIALIALEVTDLGTVATRHTKMTPLWNRVPAAVMFQ